MPITKSAKKSLKVSRTKEKQNQEREILLEKALKKVNKENLPAGRQGVNQAISLIDKAAKTGIIHKNKAARLKSRLAKKFGTPKKTNQKSKSKDQKDNVKIEKKPTKKTGKKK